MDEKAPNQSQLDKFKEAARALECDDDEERFAERIKRIGSYQPKKEKPVEKPE